MARDKQKVFENQCIAQVQDENESDCTRQCLRKAVEGSSWCASHLRARRLIDKPLDNWVISLNHKPPRRNKDGSYRRTIIGKAFENSDKAWAYARLCSPHIWSCAKPNERVRSYSVERLGRVFKSSKRRNVR